MKPTELLKRLTALSERTGCDVYLQTFFDDSYPVVAARHPNLSAKGYAIQRPLSGADEWLYFDALDFIDDEIERAVCAAEDAVDAIEARTSAGAVQAVLFAEGVA